MRRTYPYLRDPYINTTDGEKKKMNFLAQIDKFVNQRQYVRITLLNWEEEPIKEIQGEIASGSINKDGSSAVRTTCNLACSVNYGDYSAEDLELMFSINKKVFIEIGVKNETNEFSEYPILWFPQGVFFISSCSANSSSSGPVNLSLSLKDKMAGLNGEFGGVFPITTRLDEMQTQLPNGAYAKQKVLVYNLIQEMVNHIGGEQLNNIVIEDIPLRIRRVVKWNGENNLYMIKTNQSTDPMYSTDLDSFEDSYYFTVDKPEDGVDYNTYETGDDVGYVFDDFYYTKELTVNGGTYVTSALDQIKSWLGNYEYFYDEFGIFHFREIKNYLNTTQGKIALNETSERQYLVESDNSKSIYTFSGNDNIISINATPNYNNIRNDIIVTGLRKSADEKTSSMIMYHLAIDEKPELKYRVDSSGTKHSYYGIYGSNTEMLIFYEQEETGYTVASFPIIGRPEVGNNNLTYFDTNTNEFFRWDDENLVYKKIGFPVINDSEEEIESKDENQIDPPYVYYSGAYYRDENGNSLATAGTYYATDWRTHLYLKGCLAARYGTDEGYYYQELAAYWPQVYDLVNNRFYGEALKDGTSKKDAFGNEVNIHNEWRTLTEGDYYLDFVNASTAAIGKYGVDTIGRRTFVKYNEDINCIFQPEIPNVNFLNIEDLEYNVSINTGTKQMDLTDENALANQRAEANAAGYPYTQVTNDIYQNLVTGGNHNCAYDEVRDQLTEHTYFATSISITARPAYHLMPNSRVTIKEGSTNTYGDYIIKSINFALGPNGTMNVTLNEAMEKM